MVHLTPYIEQGSLYNAINFQQAIYYDANLTVHGIGISTLWCPSDGSISELQILQDNPAGSLFYEAVPGGSARMAYSSYAGMCGPWWPNTWSIPGVGSGARATHSQIKADELGIFGVCSNTRIASITDGTSNTIAFGEHGHGLIAPKDQPSWQWWDSGNLGDTLITTMFPLNPQRTVQNGNTGAGGNIFVASASSLHPGGANFAFVDGSVRFIKDSIQNWKIMPLGTDTNAGVQARPGFFTRRPGCRPRHREVCDRFHGPREPSAEGILPHSRKRLPFESLTRTPRPRGGTSSLPGCHG
jgi:prepilin-type processing-associated H-X9-DG protein